MLRLMRETGLLAPTRAGTDATGCLTDEGHATVLIALDHHCTQECIGIQAEVRPPHSLVAHDRSSPIRQPPVWLQRWHA